MEAIANAPAVSGLPMTLLQQCFCLSDWARTFFFVVATGTQVCSCSGGRAQSAALKASAAVSWTISNLLILF